VCPGWQPDEGPQGLWRCYKENHSVISKYPVEQQREGSMKEMVRYIAEALADEPENVEVVEIQGTHSTIVELKVAERDRGKIIGRQGRTADAMRTLLKAAGRKVGKTYILEIID
jgi:predicted RNA-binding protein YlqC (UPF0109 family)